MRTLTLKIEVPDSFNGSDDLEKLEKRAKVLFSRGDLGVKGAVLSVAVADGYVSHVQYLLDHEVPDAKTLFAVLVKNGNWHPSKGWCIPHTGGTYTLPPEALWHGYSTETGPSYTFPIIALIKLARHLYRVPGKPDAVIPLADAKALCEKIAQSSIVWRCEVYAGAQ